MKYPVTWLHHTRHMVLFIRCFPFYPHYILIFPLLIVITFLIFEKNVIFHLYYISLMVIISMIVVSYYIHQRFPKTIPVTVDSSSPLHCYISIVQYHCIHDVADLSILFP